MTAHTNQFNQTVSKLAENVGRPFQKHYKLYQIFGIELETEGQHLPAQEQLSKYWMVKADGSLRGEAAEYVLTHPLSRKFLVNTALPYFKDACEKKKTVFEYSGRCSTHVHVNVQDLPMYQVYAFACLFIIFEPLFWKLLGPERDGNGFCTNSSTSPDIVELLLGFLKGAGNGFANRGNQNIKYSSLNLGTIFSYGSVEARGMEGTSDIGRINTWLCILEAMRAFAKELQPADLSLILTNFSRLGPWSFLVSIFKTHPEALEYFTNNFTQDEVAAELWESMVQVQPVLFNPVFKKLTPSEFVKRDKGEQTRVTSGDYRLVNPWVIQEIGEGEE